MLMYASLPILSNQECKKWYKDLNTPSTIYTGNSVRMSRMILLYVWDDHCRFKEATCVQECRKEEGMGVEETQEVDSLPQTQAETVFWLASLPPDTDVACHVCLPSTHVSRSL